MTDLGGPSLPQERRLVTAVPGPRSAALMERRNAVVARGIGTTLPVFVERAGGGVLVDVDGNSLIDFGSGIAVASVGNAADAVVAGCRSRSRGSPTPASWSRRTRVRRRVRGAGPAHARRPREASALFNSGAEAVENAVKIARAHTGGRRSWCSTTPTTAAPTSRWR
jgi:4-aminobutyrate aminotransferase/(S)-3-amino-2-methylpropionate transaminase